MAQMNGNTRTNAQTSRPGWRPAKRQARVRDERSDAEKLAEAEALRAMFRQKVAA